jgi:hypothetical protein
MSLSLATTLFLVRLFSPKQKGAVSRPFVLQVAFVADRMKLQVPRLRFHGTPGQVAPLDDKGEGSDFY